MEKKIFDNKSQYEVPQSETIVLSQENAICGESDPNANDPIGGGFH